MGRFVKVPHRLSQLLSMEELFEQTLVIEGDEEQQNGHNKPNGSSSRSSNGDKKTEDTNLLPELTLDDNNGHSQETLTSTHEEVPCFASDDDPTLSEEIRKKRRALDEYMIMCEKALEGYKTRARLMTKMENQVKILEQWRHFKQTTFYLENLSQPVDMFFANQEGDGTNPDIFLGSNRTRIKLNVFRNVDWSSCSSATRALLRALFTREELATCSVSPISPKPGDQSKKCLDPAKIEDIIEVVSSKGSFDPKYVRTIITSKCADECKVRLKKQAKDKTVTEF